MQEHWKSTYISSFIDYSNFFSSNWWFSLDEPDANWWCWMKTYFLSLHPLEYPNIILCPSPLLLHQLPDPLPLLHHRPGHLHLLTHHHILRKTQVEGSRTKLCVSDKKTENMTKKRRSVSQKDNFFQERKTLFCVGVVGAIASPLASRSQTRTAVMDPWNLWGVAPVNHWLMLEEG